MPSTSTQPPTAFWRRIWNLNILNRVRNFIWLACQNALPTRENLYRRRIIPEPSCPLCKMASESLEHLFLLCVWTQSIWTDPLLKVQISLIGLPRLETWLQNFTAKSSLNPSLELVTMVMWNIWKTRNNWIFRKQQPHLANLVEEAAQQLKTFQIWNLKNKKKVQPEAEDSDLTWVSPPAQYLKWNIDGSFVEGENTGFVAGVLRDSLGVLISGFARQVPERSIFQTEAIALMEALSLIRQDQDRSIKGVIVHSDCFDLVEAVSNPDLSPWQMRHFIVEAGGVLGPLAHTQLAHCKRESNAVADWIVVALRKQVLPRNWLSHPPVPLWDLLCAEFQTVVTAT